MKVSLSCCRHFADHTAVIGSLDLKQSPSLHIYLYTVGAWSQSGLVGKKATAEVYLKSLQRSLSASQNEKGYSQQIPG